MDSHLLAGDSLDVDDPLAAVASHHLALTPLQHDNTDTVRSQALIL